MNYTKIISYFQLHLIELKYNLYLSLFSYIYIFLICYYYSNELIYIYLKTLINLNILKYLIYTDITEFFYFNFLIIIITSIYIYIPFFLIQYWFFLSNGLTKIENLKIIKFLIYFNFLNLLFFYLIFIKIIPNIWIYFYNFNINNNYLFNIYLEPKLINYFNFILNTYLYIYILLFYPFILYILIILNIMNIKNFIYFRKFFYLKFLIITLLISPPDIINQVLILIPLIFLFEIFIYIYIYIQKYKKIN